MQHCRFDAYIKLNKGKVAIEFDGSIHSSEDVKANDEIRDARLRRNDYIVLRFNTLGLAKRQSHVHTISSHVRTILDILLSRNYRTNKNDNESIISGLERYKLKTGENDLTDAEKQRLK